MLRLAGEPLGVVAELLLYRDRRVQRALRMVLVRERRTEQREDAISRGLNDVTVVAMDGFDRQLERGIDDGARLLGVEVAHQLSRALDVGEQRRHRLALPLDRFGRRAIGGDYDVRFRRGNGRGDGGFCGANRSPAFLAESRTRTHRCFSPRANQLQLRAASLAEPGVTGVVAVAGRTAHRVSCRPGYYHTLRGRRKEDGAR